MNFTVVRTFVRAHRKVIVAVAGAAVTILSAMYGPDAAIVIAVTSLLTALGVYAVPKRRRRGRHR